MFPYKGHMWDHTVPRDKKKRPEQISYFTVLILIGGKSGVLEQVPSSLTSSYNGRLGRRSIPGTRSDRLSCSHHSGTRPCMLCSPPDCPDSSSLQECCCSTSSPTDSPPSPNLLIVIDGITDSSYSSVLWLLWRTEKQDKTRNKN